MSSAWSENNYQLESRKLKEIVAEFGLTVPYSTHPDKTADDNEDEIINCNRVTANSFLNVGSKYREYHLLTDVEAQESGPKRTRNNFSRILIDGALRLKSVFQCITFKREPEQLKRDVSKDKSSLCNQNYDISLEHLESSQVIFYHCTPQQNNTV